MWMYGMLSRYFLCGKVCCFYSDETVMWTDCRNTCWCWEDWIDTHEQAPLVQVILCAQEYSLSTWKVAPVSLTTAFVEFLLPLHRRVQEVLVCFGLILPSSGAACMKCFLATCSLCHHCPFLLVRLRCGGHLPLCSLAAPCLWVMSFREGVLS